MMATVTEVLKINNWEVVTILWLFPFFFFLFLLLREGACKWTGRRALKDERFSVVCSHCC